MESSRDRGAEDRWIAPSRVVQPRVGTGGRFGWLLLLIACGSASVRAAEPPPSLERASALRADGKLDEALDVLRAASREVKKASGEDSLQLLPVNELAAAILIDKGDLDTAEPLLSKVIATRQKLVDDGRAVYTPDLISSLMTLVRLQTQAKRFPDAAATAQRALLNQDRALGPDSEEAATIRGTLESVLDSLDDFLGPSDKAAIAARDAAATTFTSLGLLRPAVEQRRKVLAGTRSRGDGAAADSFAAAERLCRLMMAAGLAAEAIPIAEEAVQQAAAAAVPVSPAGPRLVAELQLADGQFINAAASFKSVADSIQATKGSPPLASSGDRLHGLLIDVRRGRVTALPDWFAAELKLLVSATPADRDAAAAGLAIAAEILAARGDHAAAVEQLTRAVAVAGSGKNPSAETVAELSGRLGAALMAAGKPTAALEASKTALANAEKKLGPGDAPVSFLRVMVTDGLRQQGNGDAARKFLSDALSRELPRPDDDREALFVGVVDALAAALPDEPIRDLFIQAREQQFGAGQHRHVGTAWSLFAAARLAAGDWSTATDFLNRALTIYREGLGEEHPEVAATSALLAHAQLAGGDASQAGTTAAGAVDAWERLAGGSHPGTLAAVEVLARARLQAGERAAAEPLFQRLCENSPMFSNVKQADHLVQLAVLVMPRDRGRAEQSLQQAAALPCWLPDADLPPRDQPMMATTAARAAYAFKQLGLAEEAAESLRKARSWASKTATSTELLDRVERLAESGELPPGP